MISSWLFTFAGKNINIGREKDQYFCRITKKINQANLMILVAVDPENFLCGCGFCVVVAQCEAEISAKFPLHSKNWPKSH